MKSEPTSYSIDDLARDKRTSWNGVRNYQARNFMKAMAKGDRVLFYHSNTDPNEVVGVAEVTREAYADDAALDKKSHYYDPKATKEKPIWEMVDISFVKKFAVPVTLAQIKRDPRFEGMVLTARGSRLSVQPVSKPHFDAVLKLGSLK